MLPVVYTLVVLGCGHAVEDCTHVFASETRWLDREACERAVPQTLQTQSGHPFPVLIGICEDSTKIATDGRGGGDDRG